MENNFLAMEKKLSTAWSHFLSFSQANINFLAWEKYFAKTKNILSRQMDGALVSKKYYLA